jgi:outer membrane protein TolC
LLVLAAICSLPEATATAASRRLTYREAVGIAAERNPDVRSAAATVDAAVAKAKSAWGALLPQIQVQGGIMYWNDTLKSNFFDSSGVTPPPPPETAFEQWLMTSLLSTFTQSIVIREQLTGQLALQASQPLTSFFPLYQVFQMQRRAEDAARFDAHTTRDQVVKQAKVNYLELLRVMNLEQIARTAVEQVDAHRKVADSFYRAGVVGREQVLKAEVQLAQSREQVIRATAGVALLRSVLATSLGLDPAQEIEPVDESRIRRPGCS